MNLGPSLLVLAWLGAGPVLAQESGADVPGEAVAPDASEGEGGTPAAPDAVPSTAAPTPTDAPAAAGAQTPAPSGADVGDGAARDPLTGAPTGEIAPSPRTSPASEFERLFGAEPPAAPTPAADASPRELNLPETPGWMWPVGLTMLALLLFLRWQLKRGTEAPSRIRVVQRVMLGREGNLAVVELGDGSDRRRLLVGYGGGAPRLVAELDVTDPAPTPAPADTGTASRRWAQAVSRAVRPAGSAPLPAEAASPDEPRLRPRSSLIAEVLAERDPSEGGGAEPEDDRRAESQTAPVRVPPVRPSPGVAPDDETGEDEPPSETYTFRGLIG